MALRIRLRRIGKKKQPQYRVVVAEAAAPRDGRFVEAIGHCNPRVDPPAISVNEERALYWLEHGAQPSETVLSVLKRAGVWEKFSGEPAPVPAPVVSMAPAEEPASVVSEALPPTEPQAEEAPAKSEDEPQADEAPSRSEEG